MLYLRPRSSALRCSNLAMIPGWYDAWYLSVFSQVKYRASDLARLLAVNQMRISRWLDLDPIRLNSRHVIIARPALDTFFRSGLRHKDLNVLGLMARLVKPAWFDAWMRELLPKERYTVQELAQALELGQKTLYYFIRMGWLQTEREEGRHYISREAVKALLIRRMKVNEPEKLDSEQGELFSSLPTTYQADPS